MCLLDEAPERNDVLYCQFGSRPFRIKSGIRPCSKLAAGQVTALPFLGGERFGRSVPLALAAPHLYCFYFDARGSSFTSLWNVDFQNSVLERGCCFCAIDFRRQIDDTQELLGALLLLARHLSLLPEDAQDEVFRILP